MLLISYMFMVSLHWACVCACECVLSLHTFGVIFKIEPTAILCEAPSITSGVQELISVILQFGCNRVE